MRVTIKRVRQVLGVLVFYARLRVLLSYVLFRTYNLRYDSRNMGKIEQAKRGVGLTSLSTCDRPPSAARQGASNGHVIVSIRDMALFDPFTGDVFSGQGRGNILPVAPRIGLVSPHKYSANAKKNIQRVQN